MLEKRVSPLGAPGTGAVGDPDLVPGYPSLSLFLTQEVWADGAKRQTGTFMVFADAGRLKVMLKDRDSDAVAFTTLDDAAALWEALEKAVEDAATDWRASKYPPRSKKP